jgi:type IV secretion system protein TrbE
MLDLREYRAKRHPLVDYLPWAVLVAPGIVLNKDGSLQRTARFRGPDLESATPAELVAVTARLNSALRRLGSGWALFVEAQRNPVSAYPDSAFPEAVSSLVDQERRAQFEAGSPNRRHYESTYYLSFVFLPPEEAGARAGRLLFDRGSPRRHLDWREIRDGFIERTDRILQLLDGFMPEAAWLDDGETLTYLHSTVSTRRHRVAVPQVPMYLDAILADAELAGGLEPRLGGAHLRTLTVQGFPHATFPGILDDLNQLAMPYRWVIRWIALDKTDATGVLTRMRRQWFAKRKSIVTLLREIVYQQESPLIDSDAHNKAMDADEALQALGDDLVSEGYVTATVTVWDEDPQAADTKLKAVEKAIHGHDFTTIDEDLGAIEAWLGSHPGNCYANVRQPIVSSLNLVHMLPLSAVWAGPAWNEHLNGPPVLIAETEGSTPFRLSLHQGDVGHALIVGPTGSGKSVLLNLIMLQWRRYPASQIDLFDIGGSARATVLALGGRYHRLALNGSLQFQPLADIDDPSERAWAADWIAALLIHEQVTVDPEVKDTIWSALGSLVSAPREERTLTGLSALLQSQALKQALQPYTLSGPFGHLLDSDRETLAIGPVQAFELEELRHAPAALLPVLTYLFHRLEARLDGSPTLLMLSEAWAFLDNPTFAPRIREWLKILRKKEVSVVFATQSLSDIEVSSIAPAIAESCMSRIFLPNDRALEPQIRQVYQRFGLNDRQLELLARAQPKRDYYFQSRSGNRLFELGLGEVALALAAAGSPADLAAMDAIEQSAHGSFAQCWLHHRGLDWAADLMADHVALGGAP